MEVKSGILTLVVSGHDQNDIAEILGMSIMGTHTKLISAFRALGILSSKPCDKCGCMSMVSLRGDNLCFRHMKSEHYLNELSILVMV